MTRGILFGAMGKLARLQLACAGALALFALPANAQIFLFDGNSTASIDPTSQAGMYAWNVNGVNQLSKQWFWYSTGTNAVKSIDTISAPTITLTGANAATTAYNNGSGFSVKVSYTLTGGAAGGPTGTKVSDIGESIRIDNTSANPLSFHFYQYSDFNLLGTPGNENVELSKSHGLFNDAYQLKIISGNTLGLNETVVTPGANHGEAELSGITLAKLNGSSQVILSDAMTAGVGDVTWAFQWDLNINPGESAIISKDKYLEITIVPEPSTVGLFALGVGAFLLRRRHQRA